jgi:hypothetical protein
MTARVGKGGQDASILIAALTRRAHVASSEPLAVGTRVSVMPEWQRRGRLCPPYRGPLRLPSPRKKLPQQLCSVLLANASVHIRPVVAGGLVEEPYA